MKNIYIAIILVVFVIFATLTFLSGRDSGSEYIPPTIQ
jgi:hypothetical protein